MAESLGGGAMTSRRTILRLLPSAGVAAALTGRAAAVRGADLIPIRIFDSVNRWGSFETVLVADAKGFFRKEGLQLELVKLPPEQYTIAIDSGVTDFSPTADYIYFVNVLDKGLAAQQVIASSPYIDPRRANDGLFVLEKSAIHSPADLKGKTVGLTGLQFSGAWYTLDYLGRAGLRRDDVTYVAIPALQQEQVLVRGDVDAIYAFSPIDAMLRRKGGYRQLFSTADIPGRRILRGATMVKDEFIRKSPDTVRRYVAALANTIEWANRTQGEVVDIGIKLGRLDPALAPYVYTLDGKGDYSVLTWPEHGLQNADDITFWLGVAERQDVVPAGKLKVQTLYTDRFNPYR